MSSKEKLEIDDKSKNNYNNHSNNQYKIHLEDLKDKTQTKQKWFTKLRSANRKNSNKKLNVKVDFNMEGLGSIELAKLHRDANKPLKKIKEFDEKVEFCPCCSLPKKKEGYIEEFNFNENIDEFSLCGMGIPLYFSFFRFCLIILIFTFISVSIPSIIFTNYYTNQLIEECNKLSLEEEINNSSYPECINFIKIEGKSKYSFNDSDWALRYTGINLKHYKLLYFNLTHTNKHIEKTTINYSIVYFINLISLNIINLFYIVLLYNINKKNDMLVTTPGDYTAMISNLYYAFEIFFTKIKKINEITNINKNSNIFNANETDRISKGKNLFITSKKDLKNKEITYLGLNELSQDKEINILEGFNTFIKNRICVSTDGEKYNVSQINICYKIDELKKIEDKIQDRKSKILKIKNDPKQKIKNEKKNLKDKNRRYYPYLISLYGLNMFNLEKCKSLKLCDIESEIVKLENEMNKLFDQSKNLTKENFTGVIFVTFNTKEDKEKFLSPYPESFVMFLLISILNLRYYFCGCFIHKSKKKRFLFKKNMTAEAAPEPEEVQFENLEISSYERFCRALFIYFISFGIIAISFILISRLNLIQKNIKSKNKNHNLLIKYGVSLVITFVISIINIIFQIFLEFLTKLEKHITMTNHYLSFSIKLTLFTFITSSIIPLASNYIYNNGDYDLLVANMFILFLTNSFVSPIMWTLNFKYFLKKIIQFIVESKKMQNCTQRELNNLYELPDMKISYKYSYLAKTLLMSFLYIPIFPLGILISLLGLILGYFLEKYNFVKMYKRPEMLNSNLCSFYSNYFIINFFMLGLGDYLFIKDNNHNRRWSSVNLYFSAILIFIPYNQIFTFDFIGIKESQLKNAKTYDEEYFEFYNDYERSNPMTKKEGMKRFIFKLKQKRYINTLDEAIYKTLDNINLMEMYYQSKKNYSNSIARRSFVAEKGTKEYENLLRQFSKGAALKNIKEREKSESKSEESEESDESEGEENISDSNSANNSVDMKPINNLDRKNLLTYYLHKNTNNNIIINNNININININSNSSNILNEDNSKISSKDNKLKNSISNINNNNLSNLKKFYDTFICNNSSKEINFINDKDIVLDFEEKINQESMDENIDSDNLEKKITNFIGLPTFSGAIFNSNLKNDNIKKEDKDNL